MRRMIQGRRKFLSYLVLIINTLNSLTSLITSHLVIASDRQRRHQQQQPDVFELAWAMDQMCLSLIMSVQLRKYY